MAIIESEMRLACKFFQTKDFVKFYILYTQHLFHILAGEPVVVHQVYITLYIAPVSHTSWRTRSCSLGLYYSIHSTFITYQLEFPLQFIWFMKTLYIAPLLHTSWWSCCSSLGLYYSIHSALITYQLEFPLQFIRFILLYTQRRAKKHENHT